MKKERREEIRELHKRLKNSENFFKTLGVMAALEEVISPYQKWGQRQDISALERAWMKAKMQRKIDTMTRAEISDNIAKQLRKIDFDNSR